MTDTFTWRVTTNSNGGGEFTVANIQFGDGYSQEVPLGINAEVQKWNVTCVGYKDEVQAIVDFLRANKGKAFYWKPPLAPQGLFRLTGQYKPVNVGGMLYTINMDFVQVFGTEHEAP